MLGEQQLPAKPCGLGTLLILSAALPGVVSCLSAHRLLLKKNHNAVGAGAVLMVSWDEHAGLHTEHGCSALQVDVALLCPWAVPFWAWKFSYWGLKDHRIIQVKRDLGRSPKLTVCSKLGQLWILVSWVKIASFKAWLPSATAPQNWQKKRSYWGCCKARRPTVWEESKWQSSKRLFIALLKMVF